MFAILLIAKFAERNAMTHPPIKFSQVCKQVLCPKSKEAILFQAVTLHKLIKKIDQTSGL